MDENIEQIVDRLKGFCPVDISDAIDYLLNLVGGSELLKALKDIYPDQDIKEFFPDKNLSLDFYTGLQVVDKHIAPINVEYTYELYINGDGDDKPIIIPAPLNIFYDWGWDDFDNANQEPPNSSPIFSLDYFIKWMDLGVSDDLWDAYSFYFNWQVPNPEYDQSDASFSNQTFKSLLKENGLECMINAFNVVLACTDNPLLDWTCDPEVGSSDVFYYDAGDLIILNEHWDDAQPIVADYKLAKSIITPDILRKLADIYLASFIPDSKKAKLKTKTELNIQPYPISDPIFTEAQQVELFEDNMVTQ